MNNNDVYVNLGLWMLIVVCWVLSVVLIVEGGM
jgi:hypothetical protein